MEHVGVVESREGMEHVGVVGMSWVEVEDVL